MNKKQRQQETITNKANRLSISEQVFKTLIRIERQLHRHAEASANGDIVEDTNGKTYRVLRSTRTGEEITRYETRNMHAGAIRRLTRIAQETGIVFYVQTDPRGTALYAFTASALEEMRQRNITPQAAYYPYGIAISI